MSNEIEIFPINGFLVAVDGQSYLFQGTFKRVYLSKGQSDRFEDCDFQLTTKAPDGACFIERCSHPEIAGAFAVRCGTLIG